MQLLVWEVAYKNWKHCEYFSSSFFIDIHFLTVVKHILYFIKSSLCDHLISDILYFCQTWLW